MALNIQRLVDQINVRIAAADGSTPASEINKLIKLAHEASVSPGVREYQSVGDLPTIDSSELGELAYVRDQQSFYYGKSLDLGWVALPPSSSVELPAPFVEYLQGTQYGFVSGGSPTPKFNIEKFSMTNDLNSFIVGSLVRSAYGVNGSSSRTHGYLSGGAGPPSLGTGTVPYGNDWIQRFPFTADGNSVQVGTLGTSAGAHPGARTTYTQGDEGFRIGGYYYAVPTIISYNFIDKFPFSSETTATQVAAISAGRTGAIFDSGISGYTRGYAIYGYSHIARERWDYVSTSTGVAIGDLTYKRYGTSTASSDVSGYVAGGYGNPPTPTSNNKIDKFPFANDENTSTTVGVLSSQVYNMNQGQQSTTHGYATGGTGATQSMSKYLFASDGNSVSVGSLTVQLALASGQQV